MQLRVQKKYRAGQRRRNLISFGTIFRLLLLVALVAGGYWLANHPQEAQDRAENAVDTVRTEFTDTRQRFFPPAPTATPDVRTEVISAENAYLRGDMEEAIEYYRLALPGRPNDVEMHYRFAHTLIITSDFGENVDRINEAIEVGELTINANPESPLGWLIKAMALDWSGDYAAALASAERGLELAPNSPLANAIIANIYRNVGQFELASTAIQKAVEGVDTNPNTPPYIAAQVYRNYARYLVSQADFEAAEAPYNAAYQAMPNHTYIAVELASQVYFTLQQYSQAIALLQSVRDTNPRDASILYWLSVSYGQLGQAAEQQEILTVCVDANPNYVPCLSVLGQARYFEGNYIQSIDFLTRATEGGSRDPYDWYLLARAYVRIQRCEDAVDPFLRGYDIIKEVGDTAQVDQSNFVTEARACGLTLQ